MIRSMKICSVDSCDNATTAKGYCPKHYAKHRKYGNPLAGPGSGRVGLTKTCTIKDCNKKHISRGMCGMHYRRWMLYKDPNKKLISGDKKRGKYKIVQANGHPNANKKGSIPEHRLIMSEHLGRPLRPGENVHHINGNPKDNRVENLELWVIAQPSGQRPDDLVEWAITILEKYAPNKLNQGI